MGFWLGKHCSQGMRMLVAMVSFLVTTILVYYNRWVLSGSPVTLHDQEHFFLADIFKSADKGFSLLNTRSPVYYTVIIVFGTTWKSDIETQKKKCMFMLHYKKCVCVCVSKTLESIVLYNILTKKKKKLKKDKKKKRVQAWVRSKKKLKIPILCNNQ